MTVRDQPGLINFEFAAIIEATSEFPLQSESQNMQQVDVVVIGGGIVGLATAFHLTQKFPERRVVVLEKEPRLAEHQTGHNSGVLHSGIYYKPGSLKAINCREGKLAMEQFCAEQKIDYDICGKVIVAIDESELPALQRIYERGVANGINCSIIERERLHELEPHAAGIKAIHVPEAGIVNYRQVCERLGDLIRAKGHQVLVNGKVTSIKVTGNRSVVSSQAGEFETRLIINCAGLHCDRVAKLGHTKPDAKIVPFRGEYFELVPEKHYLCRNLIYPVPDPKFPFLGVHFTRMIEGGVECGPNAVLAFGREGYKKTQINFGDLFETMTYSGFIRMALKHWRMGMGEMWRSFSKAAFVKALQRLMPEIRAEDMHAAPAGIRAQAVLPDGNLVDDFLILESPHMININNAPSPAATASLNIGRLIVEKAAPRFS
jgi:(S)-2-hydroxyglutarate dehydrogenase